MKNEKIILYFVLCFILFCFAGCKSTELYNYGSPDIETRECLDELREEQSELARTGEQIRAESEAITEISGTIKHSAASAAGYYQEIRAILDEIRKRKTNPDE